MQKKIPQRQCMGCRERKEKRELIRVVRSPEGTVSLDFGGRKPGRGAYVCHDVACLQRARKSRALERAFETAIPAEVQADGTIGTTDHTDQLPLGFPLTAAHTLPLGDLLLHRTTSLFECNMMNAEHWYPLCG